MRAFAHSTGCNNILAGTQEKGCERVAGWLPEAWKKQCHILSEVEVTELTCQTALHNAERKAHVQRLFSRAQVDGK